MKKHVFLILLLTPLFVFNSCDKIEFETIAFATVNVALTQEAIQYDQIIFGGSVDIDLGPTRSFNQLETQNVEIGYVWSTNPNPTYERLCGLVADEGGCQSVIKEINRKVSLDPLDISTVNLKPGHTYYIRAFIFAEDQTYYSSAETFIINWSKLTDLPLDLKRQDAVNFVVNNQAFILTGQRDELLEDIWSLEINTSDWQEFGTLPTAIDRRTGAISFQHNGKPYIGFGKGKLGVLLDDLNVFHNAEWVPVTNDKISPRESALSLSLNDMTFIGMGKGPNGFLKDLWLIENDQILDSLSFPIEFASRSQAIAFTIDGQTGYIGFGESDKGLLQDLWKFSKNQPPQQIIIDGPIPASRKNPICFVLNEKAYIGLGVGENGWLKDLWEFDPETVSWKYATDFPGEPLFNPIYFSHENIGYVMGGLENTDQYSSSFWRFQP